MANEDIERIERLAAARAKYGDNRWWESSDDRILAYFQLREPVLCCGFSRFHEALETLLGRPVWTHELGVNLEGLVAESEAAWTGTPYSEDGKHLAVAEGMQKLTERIGSERIIAIVSEPE